MTYKDSNNREIEVYDAVRILVPISGVSEAEDEEVSFPAGTEGTVIDMNGTGLCLVEISWKTSEVSNDGLLVPLEPEKLEIVWRLGEKDH